MNDGISDMHVGNVKAIMPDRDTYPLYALNAAKQMHSEQWNKKIRFVLITPDRAPTECEWVDTELGFFVVVGKEKDGFLTLKQLPPDALIINQHYVDE
jgi:hypothetical protein